MKPDFRRKCLAEAIGTFALVFAGTAAIVVDRATGGGVSHVGVALTFGLVVFAMIAALGDVSGAHLNPAVTLGFYIARRTDRRTALGFVVAQCAGAVAASLAVRAIFPHAGAWGATTPAGPAAQSFALEVLLAAALMFVILNVSTGASEKGLTAGLAIGGTVALEALFAGPISGASMNPARSLGPAVAAMSFANLWLYLIAPPLGAAIAVLACRCVRDGDCCGPTPCGVTCR
jgi:aquaporin NIP